ncbi:hypothetical protein HMI01_11040 [Halolactibacillus miurensis]|uniref:Uncharacterized protein n=1 Tax=Halolactibacillus miurensis TaxID=306541 RepID=A0A1I6SGP3_9BACI|nr:hypothetical protein [Halolactibacillus miurensis]GEM04116.1 hypothetical protein HMI01_11040 [Halolactibacillus miurensis]SFS76145.1 hypothetical protein SAMN05421668_10939 [Halolactibacillus miurensis]
MNEQLEHLKQKRLEVLEAIKPICEAYGIDDYDYEINPQGQREILRIGNTRIGCSYNSIFAVKQELTGYIFISMWKGRSLGAFSPQTKKSLKVIGLRR